MKDVIASIAEAKIREAIERGEFNNLPGKGKPIKIDDLSHIPEDLRMSYKILKNSGFIPEELELQKKINSLQKLLDVCYEIEDKDIIKKELLEIKLKYKLLMEKRIKY